MALYKIVRKLLPKLKQKNDISIRKRCFNLFEYGHRPVEAYHLLTEEGFKTKERTVMRYFQQWKHYEKRERWRISRSLIRRDPLFCQEIANQLGVPPEALRIAANRAYSMDAIKKRLGLLIFEENASAEKIKLENEMQNLVDILRKHQDPEARVNLLEEKAKHLGISTLDLLRFLEQFQIKQGLYQRIQKMLQLNGDNR